MTKYYVITKMWNNEVKDLVETAIGTFTTYVHAEIFREAYNMRYSATAIIKEVKEEQ